jgi:hypothetical protein
MLYLSVGRRELGKTTLVTSRARQVPQRVFLDPRRMIRNADAVTVTEPGEIGPAMLALWEHPETQHELIIAPGPRVRPWTCFAALSEATAEWIVRDETAPLAVVLDEMRLIDPDKKADKLEAFDFVLRGAPRNVVHVYMTCHRPKDVSPNIRAILDHWMLFRCTQEIDLEAIREVAGPDVVRVVQSLPPYHWLQWDDSKGAALLHATPGAWFVPLKEIVSDKGAIDTFAGLPASDPMNKGRLFG